MIQNWLRENHLHLSGRGIVSRDSLASITHAWPVLGGDNSTNRAHLFLKIPGLGSKLVEGFEVLD